MACVEADACAAAHAPDACANAGVAAGTTLRLFQTIKPSRPADPSKIVALTPAIGATSGLSVAFVPLLAFCGVFEELPAFPFVEAGIGVVPGLAVGELEGVGLGVTFGVPLSGGVGNGPAGPSAATVAVGGTTGVFMGGAVVGVGASTLVGVGIGVAVGGV
jgi:hypothetical protein